MEDVGQGNQQTITYAPCVVTKSIGAAGNLDNLDCGFNSLSNLDELDLLEP